MDRLLISAIEERLDAATARGLVAAVSRAVRDGVLPAGAVLPPIRALARELTMSPTTVSAAWAQLAAAGLIRTAGRHGTFVTGDTSGPPSGSEGRYRRAVEHPAPFALDLSTGVPDERLLPALRPALRALTTAGTPRSYLEDPVLPELREVLRTSWPYDAPALTVVDGAMDGIDLVIRSLVRFGDRVVVEHPTFPPLLDLLEAAGADIVGVPLDEQGLVPDALAEVVRAPARAVFLQPRAHNPTGISLTASRAEELASVLAGTDTVVVEDDSTSALCVGPDVTLARWLPHQTVHVRSYSKSHGPDLRLAAMSGPEALMGAVGRLRQRGQGWSSRLLQRVLFELLGDDATVEAVAAAGATYAARRTGFVSALAAQGLDVVGTEGLNAWVPVVDEAAALVRLAADGIGVAPGGPFRVLPGDGGHVRVTTALIRDDVTGVAAAVAAAAGATAWRSGAR